MEKRRSSASPRWSRITPMNQRKAIPEYGTRRSASETVFPLVSIQVLSAMANGGIDRARSIMADPYRTANRMPEMAAARGALSFRRVRIICCSYVSSLIPDIPARLLSRLISGVSIILIFALKMIDLLDGPERHFLCR